MEAQAVATNEPVVARNVWNLLDVKMGTKTRARLRILREENLEFLEEQISWKDGISETDAHIHVEEYRRFIALCVVVNDSIFRRAYLKGVQSGLGMPSKHVDRVWHRHILFTHEYPVFCGRVNGGMIHHNPCTKENLVTMTSNETEVAYKALFGEMAPLWFEGENFLKRHSGSCDSDCSGCKGGGSSGGESCGRSCSGCEKKASRTTQRTTVRSRSSSACGSQGGQTGCQTGCSRGAS